MARIIFGFFFALSRPHTDTISLLCGLGAMIILALGSIHQLGLQDVILTALLLGGLLFYMLGMKTQEN